MQVVIKPIPEKKSWHGKNGKESFARPHSLEVLLDPSTGRYATGLTNEDIEFLRTKHNINLDLSDHFDPDKPHPYWGSNGAKIKLPNHTMLMDDEKPLDFIKIKNLKASKFVANSFKDWEDGLYPEATHIIYDEREEVGMKATKVAKKNKAVGILLKMSTAQKINVVRLVSEKSVKGRSPEFIEVELDEIVNDNDKLDEFFKCINMKQEEFTVKAQILEGLDRRILTQEGNSIHYMGEKLGFDIDETVKYFLDPNNQQIKVAILEKLSA